MIEGLEEAEAHAAERRVEPLREAIVRLEAEIAPLQAEVWRKRRELYALQAKCFSTGLLEREDD